MNSAPQVDGGRTVPADGLYIAYIPRSRDFCRVVALERSAPLRKGWLVWGPFDSHGTAREPLELLREHYRAEYETNRKETVRERLAAPLVETAADVIDDLPAPSSADNSSSSAQGGSVLDGISTEVLELIRSIFFEDMKRAVREVLAEHNSPADR